MKSIIQVLLCILLGYMARAEEPVVEWPVAQSDNTVCSDLKYLSVFHATWEGEQLEARAPHKEQIKHKSKFRPSNSFVRSLYPPECDSNFSGYCIGAPIRTYRKYWLSPFYYIFLFRYTPF